MASKKKNRSSARPMLVLFLVVLPLAALFTPQAIILSVGLLPTLGAYAMDMDRRKTAHLTVGPMNVAGIIPLLMQCWHNGQTTDVALAMMSRPGNWLVMYGAALLGWGFYQGIPPVVSTLISMRAGLDAKSLRQRQAQLVDIWGPTVNEGVVEFSEDAPQPEAEPAIA